MAEISKMTNFFLKNFKLLDKIKNSSFFKNIYLKIKIKLDVNNLIYIIYKLRLYQNMKICSLIIIYILEK